MLRRIPASLSRPMPRLRIRPKVGTDSGKKCATCNTAESLVWVYYRA